MKETQITRATPQGPEATPPKWVNEAGQVFKTKKALTGPGSAL